MNQFKLKYSRLFSDASSNLNMMSYIGYLRELCFQSHKELILLNNQKNTAQASSQDTFLVSQLSEAMLRCIRAGRSLLHIMLAWSVVGPHFMEASSHSDSVVSKIATQVIAFKEIHSLQDIFRQFMILSPLCCITIRRCRTSTSMNLFSNHTNL